MKNNLITIFERYDNDDIIFLFEQIRYNNLEHIKKFVKENPEKINIQNSNKFTLLIEAVHKNKNDIVDYLLTTNIDIDIQDNYGMTALIKASHVNNFYATKALIKADANLNMQDKFNRSALLKAIDTSSYDIADLLIDSGANLNLQNRYGENALVSAVKKQYDFAENIDSNIIINLLDNGGDALMVDNHGDCFFDYLKKHKIKDFFTNKYPQLYKKYLIHKKSKKFNL